jgi:hypothetical protein
MERAANRIRRYHGVLHLSRIVDKLYAFQLSLLPFQDSNDFRQSNGFRRARRKDAR